MRGLATIPTRTDNSLRSEGYRLGASVRHGGMRTDRRSRPPPRRLEARWMKGAVRGGGEDTSGEGGARLASPSRGRAAHSIDGGGDRQPKCPHDPARLPRRDPVGLPRRRRARGQDSLRGPARLDDAKAGDAVWRRRSELDLRARRSARPPAAGASPLTDRVENLALLNAARRRLSGRGRAGAAAGRAEQTPASRRA